MIVGNGMVAGACRKLKGWENDILYASGVSNSSEQRKDLFDKEIELIKYFLKKVEAKSTFVYFSTTSILDPSKANNPYIKHKLAIEAMLRGAKINYLIVRLPNLVGRSKNPNTLTNFFADSIKHDKEIKLIPNAIRHLIDADDLAGILENIRKQVGKKCSTVNVETKHPLEAGEILKLMQEVMGKNASVVVFKENEQTVTVPDESSSTIKYIFETTDNYHRDLFRKYYAS